MCTCNQIRRIQDQSDASVGQGRRASDAEDLAQARAQTLDHQILLGEQLVDHEGRDPIARCQHDDRHLPTVAFPVIGLATQDPGE